MQKHCFDSLIYKLVEIFKKTTLLFCFFIFSLILSSCSINKYGDGYNIPENVKPNINKKTSTAAIPLVYLYYYPDVSNTILFFQLDANDLYFRENPMTGTTSARARVTLTIYTDSTKKDDIRKRSRIVETTTQSIIYDSLLLRHDKQDVFYEIEVSDLNQRTSSTISGWLRKNSHFEDNTLLFYGENKQFPLFPHQLAPEISFIRSDVNQNKTLHAQLFYQGNSASRPPFSTKNRYGLGAPDTVFNILPREIFRPFSVNKTLYLAVSPENSTAVTSICISPLKNENTIAFASTLQYITTREEYKQMLDALTGLQAYKQFWLDCAANDSAKANRLKKFYLERVLYANRHFTSFRPGWQTDRGMIYIVFGTPKQIVKSKTSIAWHYGGLVFHFSPAMIGNIHNNYVLQRSSNYKAFWYQAVESWRSGNVLH